MKRNKLNAKLYEPKLKSKLALDSATEKRHLNFVKKRVWIFMHLLNVTSIDLCYLTSLFYLQSSYSVE
jgi:hypothetical protein